MAFYKNNWFKYLKNLIIGLGASAVMLGALGKINSYPWGGTMIAVGLLIEAGIFLMLGLIPPEKDYYWEKLYPGLEKYASSINPLTAGETMDIPAPVNGEVVERQLGGMLSELQTMAKSLGSLKALQEVDFSNTSEQIKTMGNFYDKMNQAMIELSGTIDDTKVYKTNMNNLNTNLGQLNATLGNLGSMSEAVSNLESTVEDTVAYKDQLASLNKNLSSLNGVYGNVLSAFKG